jgi:hypothetical protein
MKKAWIISTGLFVLLSVDSFALEKCIPRKDLRDKHVVSYRSYNGTTRGCVVNPNFFTQQRKMGRGKMSRKFIIEICEGEPKTSPREGRSFEICPHIPKSKRQEPPQD